MRKATHTRWDTNGTVVSESPPMHLLLKPQTSILSGSQGLILPQIWDRFNYYKVDNIPLIQDNQRFTFSRKINEYIQHGTKSVLMLVDATTHIPCAALCFSYNNDDNNVYIDYFDGDKDVVACGGGATYLLDLFCSALDTITELGRYIKLTLYDVAENSSVYDAYFSGRDKKRGRCRYSSGNDDTTTERKRQKNGSSSGDEDNCILTTTVERHRGTGVAPRLRNYNLVKWTRQQLLVQPAIIVNKKQQRDQQMYDKIQVMKENQVKEGFPDYIVSTYIFNNDTDNNNNQAFNTHLSQAADDDYMLYDYRLSVDFLIKNFDPDKRELILPNLRTNNNTEMWNFLSLYFDTVIPNAKGGLTKRKTKKMKKKKMTMKKGYRVRR